VAFKFIKDLTQAVPVYMTKTVTDSEAITKGEALIIAAGKLTKATAGAAVSHIAAQSVTAGTGNTCLVIQTTPNQVYECAYTGTPDAAVTALTSTLVDIDSTGLLINAADVTGGPCTIQSIDTATTTCRVVFNNTFTAK
jgi:hypothetical protein